MSSFDIFSLVATLQRTLITLWREPASEVHQPYSGAMALLLLLPLFSGWELGKGINHNTFLCQSLEIVSYLSY